MGKATHTKLWLGVDLADTPHLLGNLLARFRRHFDNHQSGWFALS
jgi:hypothetical protein